MLQARSTYDAALRAGPLARAGCHCAPGTLVLLLALLVGCGTTRSSDSMRTATEQMLMSSAIDKAVNEINFQPLAGKEVFLDTDRLRGFVDENYTVSTLRQAMFANGVILKPDKPSAKYIAEARAGVLGTNSSSVLIGVPAVNLPNVGGTAPGVPTAIPEIPFAKTSRQAGIAKLALFAYNQQTGHPIWQSGAFPATSDAKNTWFFGAGPFQRGSIYGQSGTRFAGSDKGLLPFRQEGLASMHSSIPVAAEAVFDEPHEELARLPNAPASAATGAAPAGGSAPTAAPAPGAPAAKTGVQPASASTAAPAPKPAPAPAPTPPPPVPPPAPPVPSVPLDQPAPIPAAGLLNALGSGSLPFRR